MILTFFKRSSIKHKGDKDLIRFIQNIFGFKPDNIFLYKQAFRHKSASQAIKEGMRNSNERLEFLGDAVLGAIIAEYLFKKYPFKDEGFLTETRSKIVCRVSLNKLALKLGLDKHLITSSDINRATLGTIPGDAIEALIGAIFLDKGFDFTSKMLLQNVFNVHIDIEQIINTDVNFKSKILEYCQQEKKIADFRLAGELVFKNNQKQHHIELLIDGVVVSDAVGFSIKGAEQRAAEKGLHELGLL